jgi:DNA-binding Lrp family transcriptional regulator
VFKRQGLFERILRRVLKYDVVVHGCSGFVKKCLYKICVIGQSFQLVSVKQLLPKQETNCLKQNLDQVDHQILNLLQEDCRLSFNKIAAKTQISVGTAYNRIKNLEAAGLVKGYTAVVNPAKVGHALTAVIFIQVDGEHLPEVEQQIAAENKVVAIYDITGEFDTVLIAKFKDRVELNNFVKHLAASPHIKRTITAVSLETVKEDFRVKLP